MEKYELEDILLKPVIEDFLREEVLEDTVLDATFTGITYIDVPLNEVQCFVEYSIRYNGTKEVDTCTRYVSIWEVLAQHIKKLK